MARTKEFDEDAVLLKAMQLFWEQGYEKTSMQDLVEHMGVHKRSMYDTFGDKHTLYIKALKRYNDKISQQIDRRLEQTGSAKEAIRQLFELIVHHEEETPKGCLMVNTAVELAAHDAESNTCVNQNRNAAEQRLRRLIEAGQQSGEFAKSLSAEDLASYLNNAMTGLRVLVKTTNDTEKMQRIIDTTMSVLQPDDFSLRNGD